MKRDTITVELRDQEVMVEYRIAPAEPDVGIQYSYIDEFTLYGVDGRMLTWDLTGEEEREVAEKCLDAAQGSAEPDDPFDSTGWLGAWG